VPKTLKWFLPEQISILFFEFVTLIKCKKKNKVGGNKLSKKKGGREREEEGERKK